jgi:hypothetical protein
MKKLSVISFQLPQTTAACRPTPLSGGRGSRGDAEARRGAVGGRLETLDLRHPPSQGFGGTWETGEGRGKGVGGKGRWET